MLFAIPAAVQFLSSVSGLTHSVESFVNPGSVRDADREARAKLIEQAAIAGSLTAARIVYAGPDNVSNNEDPYWENAWANVQAQNPTIAQQAQQAGKWWPVGADFAMTDARRTIAAELSSIGQAVPQPTTPLTGGPSGEIVTLKPGPALTQPAQAAAHAAGYQLVPTNWAVVIGVVLLAGAAYFVFRKAAT